MQLAQVSSESEAEADEGLQLKTQMFYAMQDKLNELKSTSDAIHHLTHKEVAKSKTD